MTIAGISQVARSHFNCSKTSNPVRFGIITPLKNCDRLLFEQPIAIFQLSWLPRSPYNEFVPRSFSANTEKLSSSSPIKTFAAESGADDREFAIASGISSPLAADISQDFSSSGAYTLGNLTKKVEPTPGELVMAILPPRNSASFLHRDNPNPVPLAPLCNGFSIWTNSSKIRLWSAGEMPMPVSATEKVTVSPLLFPQQLELRLLR
jgi:hypothetical protein